MLAAVYRAEACRRDNPACVAGLFAEKSLPNDRATYAFLRICIFSRERENIRMSWVNDIASGLGVPVGAATLAIGVYKGCVAAEKVARPEALKGISAFLKESSWSRSAAGLALINQLFAWTFGDRHISLKCIS